MAEAAQAVAATHLLLAGAAWAGETVVDGAGIVVRPVREGTSHHDRRLALDVAGAPDARAIDNLVRAAGFVSGLELELVSIERFDRAGVLLERDERGPSRLGRAPHSPFTGIPADACTNAFGALAAALGPLVERGVPLDLIVDQINASNAVPHIHLSAQLLALASVTAAYREAHGCVLDAGSASRAAELERLNAVLDLGLDPPALARFEKLRVELLDAGFFHDPGYETGRPQRDIKFLRDVAHTIVFRLCGYAGPYYGSERAEARTLVGRK